MKRRSQTTSEGLHSVKVYEAKKEIDIEALSTYLKDEGVHGYTEDIASILQGKPNFIVISELEEAIKERHSWINSNYPNIKDINGLKKMNNDAMLRAYLDWVGIFGYDNHIMKEFANENISESIPPSYEPYDSSESDPPVKTIPAIENFNEEVNEDLESLLKSIEDEDGIKNTEEIEGTFKGKKEKNLHVFTDKVRNPNPWGLNTVGTSKGRAYIIPLDESVTEIELTDDDKKILGQADIMDKEEYNKLEQEMLDRGISAEDIRKFHKESINEADEAKMRDFVTRYLENLELDYNIKRSDGDEMKSVEGMVNDIARHRSANNTEDLALADEAYIALDRLMDKKGVAKQLSKDIQNELDKNVDEAEINWKKEKSWKIKEKFPIEVFVEKSWTGKYYVVKVPIMNMSYETFMKLDENGKVDISTYDYEDGEARFTSYTLDNIKEWGKKNKDKITINYKSL